LLEHVLTGFSPAASTRNMNAKLSAFIRANQAEMEK